VGTSSVVIDNYKKKARQWCEWLEQGLAVLGDSPSPSEVASCRRRLETMLWLEDIRLSTIVGLPLERMEGSGSVPLAEIAATLREIFQGLKFVIWLNEPVILRFRSNVVRDWSVDPDDPQGYQTFESVSDREIEVLIDDAWRRINDDSLNELMGRITKAAARESDLLDSDEMRRRRRQRMQRERRGFMGVSEARHESPEEMRAAMGL
jgi:hypothetical protein